MNIFFRATDYMMKNYPLTSLEEMESERKILKEKSKHDVQGGVGWFKYTIAIFFGMVLYNLVEKKTVPKGHGFA